MSATSTSFLMRFMPTIRWFFALPDPAVDPSNMSPRQLRFEAPTAGPWIWIKRIAQPPDRNPHFVRSQQSSSCASSELAESALRDHRTTGTHNDTLYHLGQELRIIALAEIVVAFRYRNPLASACPMVQFRVVVLSREACIMFHCVLAWTEVAYQILPVVNPNSDKVKIWDRGHGWSFRLRGTDKMHPNCKPYDPLARWFTFGVAPHIYFSLPRLTPIFLNYFCGQFYNSDWANYTGSF
ncbi:hypothetical protein B0H13DRAFT_1856039 [Mycena leptocephala]|nr:hypothetical protein B0H13DRAFT_1856039 [Mycena leptocephala]